MANNKYTFHKLLSKYEIEIPIIQRDYVQGRITEDRIRSSFLNAIKDSLIDNAEDKELHLDFLYGVIKNDKFIPLDGQQRLTTLFLLHYYLSQRDGKFDEFQTLVRNEHNTSKFSYEIRETSREFCNRLVNEDINFISDIKKKKEIKISQIIKNKNWFFTKWEQDPTISSMLVMLDNIQEVFTEKYLFDKLKEKITFSFLEPKDLKIKNSDALYIKMNSRGKALNQFENFKSKFETYITDRDTKAKLDNQWLDTFWKMNEKKLEDETDSKKREKIIEDIFEKYLNFFYNITFNFYMENIDKLKYKDKEFTKVEDFIRECSIFDFSEDIYNDSNIHFARLMNLKFSNDTAVLTLKDFQYQFNKFCKKYNTQRIINLLDNLEVEDEFKSFIEKTDISQTKRAKFYALSLGYMKGLDTDEFSRWKRVSFNLINNTLIQNPEHIIRTIKSLKKLSNSCGKDIYKYILGNSGNIEYFLEIQRIEESLKAEIIENNPKECWEKEFVAAEKHWYLKGQIGFLLKFSKHKTGNYDLNEFIKYRDKFMSLWKISQESKYHENLIHRALMTFDDYLPQHNNTKKYTFCTFGTLLREKNENWRNVFTEDSFREFLDDRRDLEQIINSYTFDCNNYKSYYINPNKNWSVISDAKNYQIYFKDDKTIDLNRGDTVVTSWGWSRVVELYSYYLFKKEIGLKPKKMREDKSRLEGEKIYLPFKTTWYLQNSNLKPCIVLDRFDEKYRLKIYFKDGFSFMFCNYKNDSDFSKYIIDILIKHNFYEKENKYYSKDDIGLCDIDNVLVFVEKLCDDFK